MRAIQLHELRIELSRRSATLLAFAMLLLAPASALAVPVDVFFQGIRPASDPSTAYGIGRTQAEMARDVYGLQIISDIGGSVVTPENTLSVTLPPSTSIVLNPDPPTGPVNRATSIWDVQNISGSTLAGAAYMLFTHTDPFSVQGVPVDYMDENVGITLDAALGWVIIMTIGNDLNEYYYPALLLDRTAGTPIDGVIANGDSVATEINYVVNQPLIGVGTGAFALPELQIGFAMRPVPEPGTALLFGLGLAGLATSRKRD